MPRVVNRIHLCLGVVSYYVTIGGSQPREAPLGDRLDGAIPLDAWTQDICVEILTCEVERNDQMQVGGSNDHAFYASLKHVHTHSSESPPRVRNLCVGHRAGSFVELLHLRTHLFGQFLRRQLDRSGFCLRVFVVLEATMDFVFGLPISIFRERFMHLSLGGRALVLSSDMSCWIGRVCTNEDEVLMSQAHATTSSRYPNGSGIAGTPSALVRLYERHAAGIEACTYQQMGDECEVAHYYEDFVDLIRSGHIVLDDRQSIFGSLLFVADRGNCPGDCLHGQFPLFCSCLTCGRNKELSCTGNAGMREEDLAWLFRVDPSACTIRRFLAGGDISIHGHLEATPVLWNGNGPGKVTLEKLLPKLKLCWQEVSTPQPRDFMIRLSSSLGAFNTSLLGNSGIPLKLAIDVAMTVSIWEMLLEDTSEHCLLSAASEEATLCLGHDSFGLAATVGRTGGAELQRLEMSSLVKVWTHHAFVLRKNVLNWYVDGRLLYEIDINLTLLGNVEQFVIGRETSTQVGAYSLFEAFEVTNEAISGDEIKLLAGRGVERQQGALEGSASAVFNSWFVSFSRIWPSFIPPASCQQRSGSKWRELQRFVHALVKEIAPFSPLDALPYTPLAVESLHRLTSAVTLCFGECGETSEVALRYAECHMGHLAASLVAMIYNLHKGDASLLERHIKSNLGCGVSGIFFGYLRHAYLSGWPIFRLASLYTTLLERYGLAERQFMAYLPDIHSNCEYHCPLLNNAERASAQTLCEYYGYRQDGSCPLFRIRDLLALASTSVNSPTVLSYLELVETEVHRWMEAYRMDANPRELRPYASFSTYERHVRHALGRTFCRGQPYLFWDFAVTGLWRWFAEVEVALTTAKWVPSVHADALLQTSLVNTIFEGMQVGLNGAGVDMADQCAKATLRPWKRDEAWATLLLSGAKESTITVYAEAIRTLHLSVLCASKFRRTFIVVTDGLLPEVVRISFEVAGIRLYVVETDEVAAVIDEVLPEAAASKWQAQRGLRGSVAAKFYLWTLEPYKRVVFLDADTLVLESIDELFTLPPAVFASDPVIEFSDTIDYRRDLLNFAVMSFQPSYNWFVLMVKALPTCRRVLEGYPLHDLTDASFLDCVWRGLTRKLGAAGFGFDPRLRMPNCSSVNNSECLKFPLLIPDGMALPRVEGGFSGCYESDTPTFISEVSLGQNEPNVRCLLPLAYASPIDFRSITWLISFEFVYGGMKNLRFPTAALAMTAISDHLKNSSYLFGFLYGKLKVLHWPTVFMKPWDHCGASQTAFDKVWWAMHERMCSGSIIPCRVLCDVAASPS